MTIDTVGPMPALGFGTFELAGNNATQMVQKALEVGYRHIDTAQIYDNEAEVGRGLQHSGVPREEIFLTTKVWVDRFSKDALPKSVEESLKKLGTDYVDLLLLHWPNPEIPLSETLAALMAVQKGGRARHIGVSNFTVELMQQSTDICGDGGLLTNQVEYHPYLNQDKVIRAAQALGMSITAYRPIAKADVFKDETIVAIAQGHGKTAAQVTLRWILQQDIVAIPRSSSGEHVAENFQIFDFQLSSEEMAAISALRGNRRLISPKSLAPDWDEPEPVAAS